MQEKASLGFGAVWRVSPFKRRPRNRTLAGAVLFYSILTVSIPILGAVFTLPTQTHDNLVLPAGVIDSSTATSSSPVIVGWGGTKLDEVVTYNASNPPSVVFPGEQSSNAEVEVVHLAQLGFNGWRLSFAPHCVIDENNFMGIYNVNQVQRGISIAQHFNFWIIIDYHGYTDIANTTNAQCWLDFWNPVVQQFKNSYAKIVWEPLNEPTGFGGSDIQNVGTLSFEYQRWINQTRSVGDTHWIVVENLCSFSCGLTNWADGYPTVRDPGGSTFISFHSYMFYNDYQSSWNNATAETVAHRYYQAVLDGTARTGWPALNTEGGAMATYGSQWPSDTVLMGSAGYSATSFHFIQTLVNLYDNNAPDRVNWIWWPMASWTDTPGAGQLGTLAPNGWGTLLQYLRVGQPPIVAISVGFSSTPISPTLGQAVTFTATASGGTPPYTFNWSFGDGATASGTSVSHTFAQSGSYNVSITARDSSGYGNSQHSPIVVASSPSSGGGGGSGTGGGFGLPSLGMLPLIGLALGLVATVAVIAVAIRTVGRRSRGRLGVKIFKRLAYTFGRR